MPIVESFSTSTSLLNHVRCGEDEAWFRLVKLYTPLIEQWSRQQGVRGSDVEDIVQNVFAATAQHIAQFGRERSENTFRGWLWTITQAKVVDHFRKLKNQPKTVGQAFFSSATFDPSMETGSSADPADERAMLIAQTLQKIQGDFSQRTWTAFWLTVALGQRTKDVAEELGMTPSAVCMCRARVMQRLQKEIGGG